jgi:hypothetical protein
VALVSQGESVSIGCRPQGSREGSGLTIYRHNVLAAGARGFGHSALRARGSHGLCARDFYHGCTPSQAAAAPLARAPVAAEQEASGEGECVGQQG